jgi:hypothetical protein
MMELTEERVEAEKAKPPPSRMCSYICYKHSLQRENKAFAKQIKKL